MPQIAFPCTAQINHFLRVTQPSSASNLFGFSHGLAKIWQSHNPRPAGRRPYRLVSSSVFTLQTLAGFPDQDSYYDMVDCLEEQSIEAKGQRHLSRKGTDLDLVEQFNIYEVSRPVTGDSTVLIGIVRNSIMQLTKEFSALIPALSRGKLRFRSQRLILLAYGTKGKNENVSQHRSHTSSNINI